MSNKLLLLVFLLLLGAWGLSEWVFTKKESSFKTELIQLDTARVDQIIIQPRGGAEELTLSKSEGGWIVTQGDLHVKAKPGSVEQLLGPLLLVKTKRIAAKQSDKWATYEVEEGQGARLQLFDGKDRLEDFIIGKFDFNPQTRAAISFLRLSGENEVYAVDGMPFITMPQTFDGFRNKSLIRMERAMEVTDFTMTLPDTIFHFSKSTGDWLVNNDQLLDSMKVENYLNILRNIDGDRFANDFEDAKVDFMPTYQLKIEGQQIEIPFEVTCYADTTRQEPFVFRSNRNTESYFSSDSTGLFATFFAPITTFLPERK
jgi:hypothetical protein